MSGLVIAGHALHAFSGEKFIKETKLPHIEYTLRVKNAVEMVAFMLHHARMKACGLNINAITARIETAIADCAIARHQAAHAGHAETAFPAIFSGCVQRCYIGLMSTDFGTEAASG